MNTKRKATYSFAIVLFYTLLLIHHLPKILRADTIDEKNPTNGPLDDLLRNGTTGDDIDSATGRVFQGQKIRSYEGERQFAGGRRSTGGTSSARWPSFHDDVHCTKWSVVTTIFEPTEAVQRASNVKGWCTLVVADTKTPSDYMEALVGNTSSTEMTNPLRNENGDVIVFLSVEDQLTWMEYEKKMESAANDGTMTNVGRFLEAIPFRHFARKNIGYLYAIAHGGQLIFDFDDDNSLPLSALENGETIVLPPLHDTKILKDAALVVTGPKAFNHHSLMGVTIEGGKSWPRGFPIAQIQNSATLGRIALEGGSYRDLSIPWEIGVLQFVANENPDVDAVHRMVHGTEHKLSGAPITLVVPSHTFVPYNAQASIHTYRAMFALFLPSTVEGRVSDIWRSYFSQRIFRDIDTSDTKNTSSAYDNGGGDGLKVVILPPDIVHKRNEHSLLADMQAEHDLYSKTEALLEFLDQWEPASGGKSSIPSLMEELWIDLYERDYIELGDVTVLQLWLSALEEVGYEFPKPPPPSRCRIKDVVLMGQFNFPKLAEEDSHNQTEQNNEEQVKQDLLFWYQKWRQRFDTVVLRGPFPEQLAKEFRVSHQIDVRPTRQRLQGDRGFVSPMDNLLSTLKQYKGNPGIKGILYVHDDMLVNTTNIFFGDDNKDSGADRTKTIYATKTDGPRTSFRIHPSSPSVASNGETSLLTELYYSTTDGFLSSNSKELLKHLDPWGSNQRCIRQYSRVARDPRSRPFLEEDGGNPFLLVPNCQQSDLFYVPTSLTNQYETIAQLLIDHDVFLECGFPKITDFLLGKQHSLQSQQGNQLRSKQWEVGASTNLSNDVVLKSVDLCTSWEKSKKIRGTPKMISGCTSDKLQEGKPLEVPYSVIHPFKLTTIGYRDWSRYFDWATMGTSMFDFDK